MDPAADKPRFMMDRMVEKVGKYVRILGYDAAWDRSLTTRELIHRANIEGRIFITRNTRLDDQYPYAQRKLVLRSLDPVQQLQELSKAYPLDIAGLFSKCIRCNIELVVITDKRIIASRVHANVYACYNRFFSCPCCGTVFWKGSHVRNTCRKLGLPDNSDMKE